MKLEDRVANLELSERLVELGAKKESHFRWVMRSGKEPKVWAESDAALAQMSGPYSGLDTYAKGIAAFDVAELGEMLPGNLLPLRAMGEWICPNVGNEEVAGLFDTEADARAKMLCYLIENKLVTP